METIKFLIVGDGNVGKTCFLIMMTSDTFPNDYIPTVLDNYTTSFCYNGKPMRMEIWDTAGQEDYKYLRPISYPHTDVFFVCFSVVDPTSFLNAENAWYPEVRHYCPHAIVILVGTKKDLRDDETFVKKLKENGKVPITYDEGLVLAKKINAHTYMECSALKKQGVKELFDCGIFAFFERKSKPPRTRTCTLL